MEYMIPVIVLLLATLASAEDSRKWYAIAKSYSGDSYGAAWNFPTKATAESAAECEKRANKGCRVDEADYDLCFIILRLDDPGLGTRLGCAPGSPPGTRPSRIFLNASGSTDAPSDL